MSHADKVDQKGQADNVSHGQSITSHTKSDVKKVKPLVFGALLTQGKFFLFLKLSEFFDDTLFFQNKKWVFRPEISVHWPNYDCLPKLVNMLQSGFEKITTLNPLTLLKNARTAIK